MRVQVSSLVKPVLVCQGISAQVVGWTSIFGHNSVAIVMKWVWAWRGRVLGAMRRERRENFLPF